MRWAFAIELIGREVRQAAYYYYHQHIRSTPIWHLLFTKPAAGKTSVGQLMPILEDVLEAMNGVAAGEATAGIGC